MLVDNNNQLGVIALRPNQLSRQTSLIESTDYLHLHHRMDQISRVQEIEGFHRRGANVAAGSTFLQDSLKQSIDIPAYISWQTLSTEVSHRLR